MNQLSFDDLQHLSEIEKAPGRTAFIDECGAFGFDFSTKGNSRYYIVCAVCVPNSKIPELESAVEQVRIRNFGSITEMKSSAVGTDYKRRNKIIAELLPLEFRLIALVADKQSFLSGTPLATYKKSFIKFLHQRLYEALYHVYPKLKIVEDATGNSDFQAGFKKYVAAHRPAQNLFGEYDFDYVDSKSSVLVQLADIMGGTISKAFVDPNSPNYLEMLGKKIMLLDRFPNSTTPYFGTTAPESRQFNQDIYDLSIKCARDFISNNDDNDETEKRLQVAFLRYLLFQLNNVDATKFVQSRQLASVLSEYAGEKIRPNYVYRRIVAQLRDAGVLIASCSQGYKIPISADDIMAYLNQTSTVVAPMLARMDICRNLILQKTDNKLDILDDKAFVQYKKLFD